jgi:Domain of unknown function (DUF6265)
MKTTLALRLLAAPLAFAVSCVAANAAPCTLSGLAWMAADWHNASSPASAQERWAIAPGGVLMGSSFESSGDGKGYAELMTVRQDGDSIRMVLRHFDMALSSAWEEKAAPMVFTAASCDGTSAEFDGQGDHTGERLIYKRTGDALLIVGEFLHQGKPDHEEWHMIAAKS